MLIGNYHPTLATSSCTVASYYQWGESNGLCTHGFSSRYYWRCRGAVAAWWVLFVSVRATHLPEWMQYASLHFTDVLKLHVSQGLILNITLWRCAYALVRFKHKKQKQPWSGWGKECFATTNTTGNCGEISGWKSVNRNLIVLLHSNLPLAQCS